MTLAQSDGTQLFIWQSANGYGPNGVALDCNLTLVAAKRPGRQGQAIDDWEISQWELAGYCGGTD
jgi:hypothetical protein